MAPLGHHSPGYYFVGKRNYEKKHKFKRNVNHSYFIFFFLNFQPQDVFNLLFFFYHFHPLCSYKAYSFILIRKSVLLEIK